MDRSTKIAVLGSINLDFVIRTATLPVAGETVSGGTFVTTPGGKGGNQALAAQRLGAQVDMHACVGADPYADVALRNLSAEGVGLKGVIRTTQAATGAAFINVDDIGENQIAVASGANALFDPDRAPQITADWIIAQLEIDPLTILKTVQQSKAKLCLNAAPVKPLPQGLIDAAEVIVVNEVEHRQYADQIGGFGGLVVLTLGSKGAQIKRGGAVIAQADAPAVEVADTTGAGDCFVAALTVFLAEGMEPDAALTAACHCGALATTQLGAQAASPTRHALQAAFSHLPV